MIAPDFTPDDALHVETFLEQARKRARKRKQVFQRETAAHVPRQTKARIASLDFETDPFDKGERVRPFAWGFFDGSTHTTWWNCWNETECIPELIKFLDSLTTPYLIYAHNGGKFDFTFLLRYITGKMLVINSRIVSAHIGKHEIRDSLAAVPVPLKGYKKQGFNYKNLHAKVRAKHYQKIIEYLKSDCEYLHELMTAYHVEFGNVKTMASAAMKQFNQFHTYTRCNENTDNIYRQFYYGGRCQCFKSGIIRQPIKIYDINSQYPFVMQSALHPISDNGSITTRIVKDTCFVETTGRNYGAFPMRTKTGLDFTVPHGRFFVTIHEWNAALDTGTFEPETVHAAHNISERVSFAEFIEHFYHARLQAKQNGDEARKLFYKLVMNSCYGKFAQNPRDFKEYEYRSYSNPPTEPGWDFELSNDDEQWRLWFKPTPPKCNSWYNVMTAASITGAARSLLMRAIISSKNVLYCDTDSVICETLSGVPIDENALGAWKLETTGTRAAIAAKKLYAVWNRNKCVKFATKGCRITPAQIAAVARGEEIDYTAEAPVCKLDGSQKPLHRTIRRNSFV